MLENFFQTNHFARILALFLAIVFWLFVEGEDITQPAMEKKQFEDVSLVTMDLDEGQVVKDMPSYVDVQLEGPQNAFTGITSRDLVAFVDLKGKEPGTHQLPVRVHPPSGLEIISYSPSEVEVNVESMETRSFDLQVALLGRDPTREVTTSLYPKEVTLRGASSCLERVETVKVFADVSELNDLEQIELEETPRPLDESREPVEDLSASPSEIEVYLELESEEKEETSGE